MRSATTMKCGVLSTPSGITLLIVVSVVVVADGDVFTSVAKLKQLPDIERKLIDACERYLNTAVSTYGLEHFKSFLVRGQHQNQKILDDSSYLNNPINGFRFLWRLVDGWSRATRVRASNDCDYMSDSSKRFLQKVSQSISSLSSWPTQDDVTGSAMALTKLIHTYDLDPDKVGKGRILYTETEAFEGDELFLLGEEMLYRQSLLDAQMWFNLSLTRMYEMRENGQLLKDVHYKLRHIEDEMIKKRKAGIHVDAPDVFFQVGEEKVNEIVLERDSALPDQEVSPPLGSVVQNRGFRLSDYQDLCQKNLKTPAEESELTCWYGQTTIPYIKAKVELLNKDPAILMFHDVISNEEIEKMKNISTNLLRRSVLGRPDGSGHEAMQERISQSAWIFDDKDIALVLSRRIELLTGLSTKLSRRDSHAEAFQVVNYGLGGMYEPHEDSVRAYRKLGYENSSTVQNSGDRMATWLYYLSDVLIGGATVFPLIKTRIPVTKGSAAFWFNLKQNGKADVRTIHAGCPVLVGDKWIANKWIREIGQVFRRPCVLDPED